MIVWGGSDGSYPTTGARYDPVTNSWTSTSIEPVPSPRDQHTAVWTGSLMIVWGGETWESFLNTGGRYDPATHTWTPTSMLGAPSPRTGHTAVWTGSEMVVWGGVYDAPGDPIQYDFLRSGGRYNPVTNTWTPTSLAGTPSGRGYHTAVWTGSVMVVWGGAGGDVVDTGGRYDPTTNSWTPTTTVGAPEARDGHRAVWTGSVMIVWGGGVGEIGPNIYYDTGGRYDPATNTWASTTTAGAPEPRGNPTAVWTGSVMIVWGGAVEFLNGLAYFDTGGRYDPVADTWEATSTAFAPAARQAHSAVWTGDQMVVWGGFGGWLDVVVHQSSGGAYTLDLSTDDDDDGYTDCAGDCDDRNSSVSPGALETCDGLDNDCTGVADDLDADGDGFFGCAASDCNDSDPGAHAAAAEVTGLRFAADGETLEWDSAAQGAGSSTMHDVLTGLVAELPVGSGASETCLASGIAESSTLASGDPASGSIYWFLVRGANSCGLGSYGNASDGSPRESTACP